MRVAYLVNQYPGPSHSFIRREIAAVEAQGLEIVRFTVRRSGAALPEEADLAERSRTRAILETRKIALLLQALAVACMRPIAFLRALRLVLRFGLWTPRVFFRHLAYLVEACTLSRWLNEAGARHLHAHFGTNPAFVAMLCSELTGTSYSFTAHGPEEFDRAEALGLREKVKRAAFVVAVCHFGRSQLLRWSRPEDWDKIRVIGCSPGTNHLDASRSRTPAEARVVCVARFGEQKGHLLLLEAAARLRREGTTFKLSLVGDGPMRRQIEARISELKLEEHVQLTGWMSDRGVREEITASRALVLPSFAEGLPVVLMEALALGRPVVATFIAGIPELVEPGVSGWLVPAGSINHLAQAIREVLAAPPSQLRQMGMAGGRKVAEEHDAQTEASRLVALFLKQIDAGAATGSASASSGGNQRRERAG